MVYAIEMYFDKETERKLFDLAQKAGNGICRMNGFLIALLPLPVKMMIPLSIKQAN